MNNPFLHYVNDFEKEAEIFLKKYDCSDAIENPQPIPIFDIATRLMSLEVIQTECLSPDDSVQGAIAFSKGVIDVYDWNTKEYMGYSVDGPAIFVDAGISNVGRINNTLAHECYHWWRHRRYFNYRKTYEKSTEFGFRCDKHMRTNIRREQWTDVERMEWQARTIAPKILMPKIAIKKKIDSLYDELTQNNKLKKEAVTEILIGRLADFFEVSKESVAIRMIELGYDEAIPYTNLVQEKSYVQTSVGNKNSKAAQHMQKVTMSEAFELYYENEMLRTTIDTGSFCFADGYFVICDSLYVEHEQDGSLCLTKYAQEHLSECILDFSAKLFGEAYLMHDASSHLMYRSDTHFEKKISFDANTQNTELFNKAKDFEKKFIRSRDMHKTATELLWNHMQTQHWNSKIFTDRTNLEPINYSRVQQPDYKFKKALLITMGIGLDLDLDEMLEILSAGGYAFNPTDRTDQAYKFLFTTFPEKKDIYKCNEFLNSINIKELGSKTIK